jgi:hypothetical protein
LAREPENVGSEVPQKIRIGKRCRLAFRRATYSDFLTLVNYDHLRCKRGLLESVLKGSLTEKELYNENQPLAPRSKSAGQKSVALRNGLGVDARPTSPGRRVISIGDAVIEQITKVRGCFLCARFSESTNHHWAKQSSASASEGKHGFRRNAKSLRACTGDQTNRGVLAPLT